VASEQLIESAVEGNNAFQLYAQFCMLLNSLSRKIHLMPNIAR